MASNVPIHQSRENVPIHQSRENVPIHQSRENVPMQLKQTGGPSRKEQARTRFAGIVETDTAWEYVPEKETEEDKREDLPKEAIMLGFLQYVIEDIKERKAALSKQYNDNATENNGAFLFKCTGLLQDIKEDIPFTFSSDVPTCEFYETAKKVGDVLFWIRLSLHKTDHENEWAKWALISIKQPGNCGISPCDEKPKPNQSCSVVPSVKYCGRDHRKLGRELRQKQNRLRDSPPEHVYILTL